MLDGDGRIIDIINNYARISFNFGPTLLAWMEQQAPDVLDAIVEADRQSRGRFSGHGSALAQAYNHMILPLANSRDKRTQVLWGMRDFEHRFGRPPEGLWLAETAADTPTLEALAAADIKFTILSPFQASRVRSLRGGRWSNVDGGRVDPSRPYLVRLPSGRSLSVFFYDAPLSKAVAFENLLGSGEGFAVRLMDGYDDGRDWDQLVHIATDGESYGHHHRYGEMALAAALDHVESNRLARLTNYGEYLERHAPAMEAQIHEPSAWSCPHGVSRWYADCGCNSGGRPGWHQRWRAPLREALDWLRDTLAPRFESMAANLLKDAWAARDDYIAVILDRSEESRAAFFERHALGPLDEDQQIAALRLLELQRHAMLMYTSCAWFFDELSGPETVQVVQYAGRAIQLLQNLGGGDLEPEFMERLAQAPSNIPEHRNGRVVYEQFVKPAIIDREKLGAHFAVGSLFEDYPENARVYSCTFEQRQKVTLTCGQGAAAHRLLEGHDGGHARLGPAQLRGPAPGRSHRQQRRARLSGRRGLPGADQRVQRSVQSRRLSASHPAHGQAFRRVQLLGEESLPRPAAQGPRSGARFDQAGTSRTTTARSPTNTRRWPAFSTTSARLCLRRSRRRWTLS